MRVKLDRIRCDRCGLTVDIDEVASFPRHWRTVIVNDAFSKDQLVARDLCPACWDNVDIALHQGDRE